MTKCMRNFALLMTIAMVASLPAVAQQAGLTGTVSDPTGAVIPGAAVTLTHKGTGASRTTTTGGNGGYLFSQLEPAQYRLEISMQGFKTVVRDPVTLPVGITSALNATMEIGDVTEQVVVEEGTTAINIVDASLGGAISGTQVLSLPSQDLDPAGLLSLQPGVTYFPSAAEESGGYSNIRDDDGRGGTVNGARSDQTNITLDGVDVNDAENGFAFVSVLRATQASLAEFRVTTSNYNADQGRSAGGQVQLVTKSGTNDLHGMAYYTHRNEAFAANDFFNNRSGVEKGELRRHIYGGALGGPIVKDRLFIFGNIERLEHTEAQTVLRTVPSASFRDGVLIYQCVDSDINGDGTIDPTFPENCGAAPPTVMGISGTVYNVAPGFHGLTPAELAAIDPLGFGPNSNVISYLAGFEASNDSGDFDGINLVGFRFNSPIENTFNTYIARAHAFLGMVYREQQHIDRSAQALQEAVKLEPGNWLAHMELAKTLLERQELEEALGHARQAHDLNAQSQTAHLLLYLIRQQNCQTALDELEKFLTLHPDHPSVERIRLTKERLQGVLTGEQQ